MAIGALALIGIIVVAFWYGSGGSGGPKKLSGVAIDYNDVEQKNMVLGEAVAYAQAKGYPAFSRPSVAADGATAVNVFKTALTNQTPRSEWNTYVV